MNKFTHKRGTDKVQLINRSMFDSIQQTVGRASGTTTTASKANPVKNSKYKRTHKGGDGFDLLQYMVMKPCNKLKKKRGKPMRHIVDPRLHAVGGHRRRGKIREGGVRKKPTRLKKSILQHRARKRIEEAQEQQLCQQLQGLIMAPPQEQPTVETAAATATAVQMVRTATTSVHSRTFRAYCDNLTSAVLGDLSDQLLRELNRFQVRAFATNPIKAQGHRRLVLGFREVQNYLRINKLKLVLIATDCEDCAGPVGLNETIAAIKESCQSTGIPYGFPLRRRQMAYALYKKVPVSCAGIADYDGARDIFDRLMVELEKGKNAYKELHLPNIIEMESQD